MLLTPWSSAPPDLQPSASPRRCHPTARPTATAAGGRLGPVRPQGPHRPRRVHPRGRQDARPARAAAGAMASSHGIQAAVWDVRLVKPLDEEMLAEAAAYPHVVTVEDGYVDGGAGSAIADRLAGLVAGEEHGRSAGDRAGRAGEVHPARQARRHPRLRGTRCRGHRRHGACCSGPVERRRRRRDKARTGKPARASPWSPPAVIGVHHS